MVQFIKKRKLKCLMLGVKLEKKSAEKNVEKKKRRRKKDQVKHLKIFHFFPTKHCKVIVLFWHCWKVSPQSETVLHEF